MTQTMTMDKAGASSSGNQVLREQLTDKLANDLDRWLGIYRTAEGKPPTEGDVIIALAKLVVHRNKRNAEAMKKWLLDISVALSYQIQAQGD